MGKKEFELHCKTFGRSPFDGWLQMGYRADLGEKCRRIEGAKKGHPKLVGEVG